MPWTGSTYRARGTGLPSFAFVATATGIWELSDLPLAALVPAAAAGCSMLVWPDHLDVTLTNTGMVETQIAIPNAPELVGTQLRQQLVVLEVDASLNFVASTSTNALALTVGAF